MHVAPRTLVLVSAAFVAAAVVACSGSDDGAPEPEPGTGDPTNLPSTNGTATSASPTSPPPASTTSAQSDAGPTNDAGSGGLADLGEACTKDEQCQSGACFVGNQSGYCSLKCTQANAATVCKPPVFNGVCNQKGFCRKP